MSQKKEESPLKDKGAGDKPQKSQNQEVMEEIGEGKKKLAKQGFLGHLIESGKQGEYSFFKKGIGGIVDEYRSFRSDKDEYMEKYTAYETVVAGATDTLEYYILLFFSCLIAVFGLLQNSPAVIIGAMIVAPLMGPIFGMAAGTLWGSRSAIWEAFTSLFKGSILVIVITSSIAYFMPGTSLTPELLSRAHPSLYDLIVAISCGFIGAFSYVNKRISSVISGVAISVALLPPLCTVGVGIGLLNWELAWGATLLFAVNLAGIILAASIVFYLVRLHPQSYEKGNTRKVAIRAALQIGMSLILIALISVPLLYYTDQTFKVNTDKKKISEMMASHFPYTRIYSLDINSQNTNKVEMVILSKTNIDKAKIEDIRTNVLSCSEKPMDLTIYVMHSMP